MDMQGKMVRWYEDARREDVHQATVIVATPSDISHPALIEIVNHSSNFLLYLSVKDVNALEHMRNAKKVYFVLSKYNSSCAYIEAAHLAMGATEGADCERVKLRLDDSEPCGALEDLFALLPEDDSLQHGVAETDVYLRIQAEEGVQTAVDVMRMYRAERAAERRPPTLPGEHKLRVEEHARQLLKEYTKRKGGG
ncbi:MAG: hypothetical protein H7Z38_05200 [Rubrivivax sp.]|nr:hypothetical protein [Pyrinomonadaceae bacterium]